MTADVYFTIGSERIFLERINCATPEFTPELYIKDFETMGMTMLLTILKHGEITIENLQIELWDFKNTPELIGGCDTPTLIKLISDSLSWRTIGMDTALSELSQRCHLDPTSYICNDDPQGDLFFDCCNYYFRLRKEKEK